MYSTFLSRVSQSWSELLQIFKPQNFKKYFYITAKSYFQTLKALLKGAGLFVFFAIAFLFSFISFYVGFRGFAGPVPPLSLSDITAVAFIKGLFDVIRNAEDAQLFNIFYWVIPYFVYSLLIFLCIAAARSSTAKKDHYYFFDLIRRFLGTFMVWLFFIDFIFILLNSLTLAGPITALFKKLFYILFLVNSDSLGIALNPLFVIFTTLFLMDSSGRHKIRIFFSLAITRLMWYTYPLTALITFGFYYSYLFLEKVVMHSSYFNEQIVLNELVQISLIFLILLFGVPLYITMLTNIYLQQMHEHYDWYHEKK